MFGVDDLIVVRDGNVGVHQNGSFQLLHHLLVFLKHQVFLLFFALQLRRVLQALYFFLAEFLILLIVLVESHLLYGLSIDLLHIYFSFLILKLLLLLLFDHLVLHFNLGPFDDLLEFLDFEAAAFHLERIFRDDPHRCFYFIYGLSFCCLLLDASKDPLATLPK